MSDEPSGGLRGLGKPWVRDFRGINRSPLDVVERGLARARAPVAQMPGSGSAVDATAAANLATAQRVPWLRAVEQARRWLPKAEREWKGFVKALEVGKPLPDKVTAALRRDLGWINDERNNHSLPPIPALIRELSREIDHSLPVRYSPTRMESPNSQPSRRRFIRATPLVHDDGQSRGLQLFPDFYLGNNERRATTVIHEILHTWDGRKLEDGKAHPFSWDWADQYVTDKEGHILDDVSKPAGFMHIFGQDPASIAALIRDLGR
ncbi:hypothetical protein UB46_39625 [Burkholderiaceae bacterium 16]|nr:hypothetical protein UB46_39625 [Burkholderiaceae bacterium 16]